jgi:hypothetical protein
VPDELEIIANGINAVTGRYDFPPCGPTELAALIKASGEGIARDTRASSTAPPRGALRGLPFDVPDHDVSLAGWGVIFHKDESQEVRKALEPLVAHRRRQIADDSRVHILTYAPDETLSTWFRRYHVGFGDIDPARVPFYLLVVGSPERIPFDFIHQLDADYCVGMLHFDAPSDYERYVQSVIAYETAAGAANRREVVFFGTRHAGDRSTEKSADSLIRPLVEGLPERRQAPVALARHFRQQVLLEEDADRKSLLQILSAGLQPPALLFTATHGVVWPSGHANQRATQGAWLCQDWPGTGAVAAGHYVSAADIPDDALLHGLIVFQFACYGAGTPARDRFAHAPGVAPPQLAPAPFIAALPQRLLSHPAGGALACIGHVERAWGYSITSVTSEPQILPFQNAIARILVGQPIGLAVQEFNNKSNRVAQRLKSLLIDAFQNQPVNDVDLASTWMECNDAEGYLVLGDPAVRLRVDDLV